jgi:hypothetical protein
VTIWDIKDACDTMKDLDEMLGFTGIQVDSAETVNICGTTISID